MKLDLVNDPASHGLVIEASAGTGKTYSVAAIVTRELALRDDLRIGQILITTFTRNAAAELRDRVRKRLVATAHTLREKRDTSGDGIARRLQEGTEAEVAARIQRLEEALVEFDSATISTIHGVCSRVLRAAGIEVGAIADTDEADRIIAEVVNDLVVSRSTADHRWDEEEVRSLVDALLGDPFLEPWFDDKDDRITATDAARQEPLTVLLQDCVDRVHAAMANAPSYNDLLRLAREVVYDKTRPDVVAALQQRFRLAIVDEAQDTDRQQWEFFQRLFPGGDGRALVSVGDPKQAIYGFRGADVQAYVAYARDAATHRTLATNRRSDQPLLDVLNEAFQDAEFGAGIEYLQVDAPVDRKASLLQSMPASVEFIDLGIATSQGSLSKPVLGKVIELLDTARLAGKDAPKSQGRLVEPKDICVLVRSGSVGRLVERELAQAGIPAVSGGTSSVMKSGMALDICSLLEAIERPSSVGRVRRAAATVFFGFSLENVGLLTEEVIQRVQDGLMRFASVLSKKGIAALAAQLEVDEAIMTRIAAGRHGERNITDFLHVMEVMDSTGPGRGCTPEKALSGFRQLAAMDDKHDLVSRRVESDADAVKILTIHAAKGLQFPCVIVADLWKAATTSKGGKKMPTVFYDNGVRKLDIGHALGNESARAMGLRREAENEESRRLLYVAATRAEHFLAILVAQGKPTKNDPSPPSIIEQTMRLPHTMVRPNGLVTLKRSLQDPAAKQEELIVAPPPAVVRTYRRMSFTGITAIRGHGRENLFGPEGGGYDEPAVEAVRTALPENPTAAVERREIIDLPAGVAVGRVIHEVYDRIDTTMQPLANEVRRVVEERATTGRLRAFRENLVSLVTETLETPLGGPFGDITLAEIPPADRLSEMGFEMGLASLVEGLRANAIGELLRQMLPADDPLAEYAAALAGPTFDVPVGGLLTGSIDAMLRLPGSTPEMPRLLLVDYKSNKLHSPGMSDPLAAYHPDRLVAAMAEHHYPLQALLYGTATYRMLRWRRPDADPDDCIAGVAYAFIRGMKGPKTPVDGHGRRYGVFTWQPPRGMWQRLSNLLVALEPAGASR